MSNNWTRWKRFWEKYREYPIVVYPPLHAEHWKDYEIYIDHGVIKAKPRAICSDDICVINDGEEDMAHDNEQFTPYKEGDKIKVDWNDKKQIRENWGRFRLCPTCGEKEIIWRTRSITPSECKNGHKWWLEEGKVVVDTGEKKEHIEFEHETWLDHYEDW